MLNARKGNYLPGPDERAQLAGDHAQLLTSLGLLGASWSEIRPGALAALAPMLGSNSPNQRPLAQLITLLDDLADVPVCEQEGCLETIENEDVDFCPKHCRGSRGA